MKLVSGDICGTVCSRHARVLFFDGRFRLVVVVVVVVEAAGSTRRSLIAAVVVAVASLLSTMVGND